MLEIKVDAKNGKVMIRASDSIEGVVTDLGVAVDNIYRGIGQNDPDAARAFKDAVQHITGDDSPVWSEGLRPGCVYIVNLKEGKYGSK